MPGGYDEVNEQRFRFIQHIAQICAEKVKFEQSLDEEMKKINKESAESKLEMKKDSEKQPLKECFSQQDQQQSKSLLSPLRNSSENACDKKSSYSCKPWQNSVESELKLKRQEKINTHLLKL